MTKYMRVLTDYRHNYFKIYADYTIPDGDFARLHVCVLHGGIFEYTTGMCLYRSYTRDDTTLNQVIGYIARNYTMPQIIDYMRCCNTLNFEGQDVIVEDNQNICLHCGAIGYDYFSYEGETYCDTCKDAFFSECSNCGNMIPITELRYIESNDTHICESCFDNDYYRCYSCNTPLHRHDDEVYWYNDCPYCESCYEENFATCGDCGETFPCDELDENGYCSDCRETHIAIHSYGYKPDPIFFPEYVPNTLYFGVEIEQECTHGISACSSYRNNHVYYKYDGSISNGFEIVSHPMTLDYHLHNAEWQELFTYMREHGARSHNTTTCGLHIHVSREYFTTNNESRLGLFVACNKGTMETLARRSSHYAKIIKKELSEYHHNYDRYEAVNYQNRRTIEFRLYKGTLNFATFCATLELTDAICRYCAYTPSTRIDVQDSWQRFMAWVSKQRYEYLPEYLVKRLETQANESDNQ